MRGRGVSVDPALLLPFSFALSRPVLEHTAGLSHDLLPYALALAAALWLSTVVLWTLAHTLRTQVLARRCARTAPTPRAPLPS